MKGAVGIVLGLSFLLAPLPLKADADKARNLNKKAIRLFQKGKYREAAHSFRVPHELGRQDLERHLALERLVLRQVHLTHATGAERADDPVMRKTAPWLKRTCHR